MSPIILNNYIAPSGKQTLTYRLYPQTVREHGPGFKTLTDYTKFDVKIYVRDNTDTVNSFDNEILVLDQHNLTKEGTSFFIGGGLPYYEYTIDFEAEVPFQINTLENTENLKNMDSKNLEKLVVEAYNYFKELIDKKNKDEVAAIIFKSEMRQINTEYFSKELVEESGNDYLFYLENESFKLEPIENYSLKLFGNGKLVALQHKDTDLKLFNESSIWGKYKTENNETRVRFYRLLLYKPKDKNYFEKW